MSGNYHRLILDLTQVAVEDESTLLAAIQASDEQFIRLWQQHDLHQLLVQPSDEDAERVLTGFNGLLRRDVCFGSRVSVLVMTASDFATLKLSCSHPVPLHVPFNRTPAQSFSDIAETMVVAAMIEESVNLRELLKDIFTRLHHITGAHDQDHVLKLRNYVWEELSGLRGDAS